MEKFVYGEGKSFLNDFVYEFNVYYTHKYVVRNSLINEFINEVFLMTWLHMFAKFKGNIYSHHIIEQHLYIFLRNSSCLVCVERK